MTYAQYDIPLSRTLASSKIGRRAVWNHVYAPAHMTIFDFSLIFTPICLSILSLKYLFPMF